MEKIIKNKYRVGVAFLLLCGVIGCTYFFAASPSAHQIPSLTTIHINGANLNVELATTTAAWEQGLSGREELLANTGMLFVFNRIDTWPMWMKDMKFSLDMIWLDARRSVVHIEEHATPESYPKIFESSAPARYVLEVPAGTVSKLGIKKGDVLTLEMTQSLGHSSSVKQ